MQFWTFIEYEQQEEIEHETENKQENEHIGKRV